MLVVLPPACFKALEEERLSARELVRGKKAMPHPTSSSSNGSVATQSSEPRRFLGSILPERWPRRHFL